MKKLLWVLPICIFLLFGCTKKDSLANDLDEILKQASEEQIQQGHESEEKISMNVSDYKFEIPDVYKKTENLTTTSEEMEKILNTLEKVSLTDEPVSFLIYGGDYNARDRVFVLAFYIFNNTEKEIENISFNYQLNLESIGGKNEGEYKTVLNTNSENDFTFKPKTVTPIFIETRDITLPESNGFYDGKKL